MKYSKRKSRNSVYRLFSTIEKIKEYSNRLDDERAEWLKRPRQIEYDGENVSVDYFFDSKLASGIKLSTDKWKSKKTGKDIFFVFPIEKRIMFFKALYDLRAHIQMFGYGFDESTIPFKTYMAVQGVIDAIFDNADLIAETFESELDDAIKKFSNDCFGITL